MSASVRLILQKIGEPSSWADILCMLRSLVSLQPRIPSTVVHLPFRTMSSAPTTLKQLDPVEGAKRAAAYAAVDNHVKPEHEIIGIGSGKYARFNQLQTSC